MTGSAVAKMLLYQQCLDHMLSKHVNSMHICEQILQQKEAERQHAKDTQGVIPRCEIPGPLGWLLVYIRSEKGKGRTTYAKKSIAEKTSMKLPANIHRQLPGGIAACPRIIEPGKNAGKKA